MFALDRLDDIGVLPDGYQSVLDPSNSYTSSTYTNSHRLSPFFIWIKDFDKSRFSIFTMYNRKNEMSIFQKRNEQIFSFFASFFLLLFRPLKHQLKADFKPLKQA